LFSPESWHFFHATASRYSFELHFWALLRTMDHLSDDGDASTPRRASPARPSSCFGLPVGLESINILSQQYLTAFLSSPIPIVISLRGRNCSSCSPPSAAWRLHLLQFLVLSMLRLHNRRKCIQSPTLRPHVRGISSFSFLAPMSTTNLLLRTSTTLATVAFTANFSKTTASRALPPPSPLT
jgi:hypothetical protein